MTPRRLLLSLALTSAIASLHGAEPPELSSKQVPGWAADAVWYQIFPERFRNGDPKNDPTRASLEIPVKPGSDWRVSSWTADWYARDAWETALSSDFYKGGVFDRRYGGDLQGVLDKLDYLRDLGINALYFNPLFYARSLHKYDASSYHHIDPYFGPDPSGDLVEIGKETGDPSTWQWTAADKLFLKVIKEAHARGMKVIVDGVFNHTGRDFFAFKDVLEKQRASPYKDWYRILSFDDPATGKSFDYEGWFGVKSLPMFAFTKGGHDTAPGPKEYIFDATRRWLDPDGTGDTANGVDGWRLDAVEQRPLEFWAEWNALVRKINPNAYTTAEIWADPKVWVTRGGFSAVMNYYGFAFPVKSWLVDNYLPPTRFAEQVDSRRDALPRANAAAMQNLMDSHDTDRLASMIVNGEKIEHHRETDQSEYHANDDLRTSPDYLIRKPDERERAVQRLVVLMQVTAVGAPMIYYGDEAGMWGATDPDDRQPMVWEDLTYDPQTRDPRGGDEPPQRVGFDKEVFSFYRKAIALRRTHAALSRGDYALLEADNAADLLVFARRGVGESLVVAFNRSDNAQMATVHLEAARDGALLTKPAVLFSTAASGSPVVVKALPDGVTVSLPPLTAAVIGAAAP